MTKDTEYQELWAMTSDGSEVKLRHYIQPINGAPSIILTRVLNSKEKTQCEKLFSSLMESSISLSMNDLKVLLEGGTVSPVTSSLEESDTTSPLDGAEK